MPTSLSLSTSLRLTLASAVLRFLRDETGASLVEYVLLVALLAVVCLGTLTLLGSSAAAKLTTAASAIP